MHSTAMRHCGFSLQSFKLAPCKSLALQPCAGCKWYDIPKREALRAIAHRTVGCWVLAGTAASCLPQRSILCDGPQLLLRLIATANKRQSLLAHLMGNKQDAGMG